jgi:squalene-hopene/tetraprenyl-beta-curcumene cyclase
MSAKTPDLTGRLLDLVSQGIEQAVGWSQRAQKEPGYWVARLESNASMEAEWLLAYHILGIDSDPKRDGVIRGLLNTQRSDGAWGVYHDAESGDLNATVETYAALRVHGYSKDHPALVKAREFILANGGVARTRVFTKIWLAMCGEWPWSGTPTLPPEMVDFPLWFPFNLYNFASWARATIVPLTLISARRPVVPFPPEARLDELFPQGRGKGTRLPWPKAGGALAKFLYVADRALAFYTDHCPWKPYRETAKAKAIEWIIRRQEADGCWAGIQPPWIYALMALRFEGYALDHPVLEKGWRCFDAPWAVEEPEGIFLQACTSPVWDTLLTQLAFLDCGLGLGQPEFDRSLEWVLGQQIRTVGDWKIKSPELEPGGWAFEYENDYYPDFDDAAVAMIVLARLRPEDPELAARVSAALERATKWVVGMRSSNGAWAAFDKDNTERLVSLIPFCDFGEALDPPSVDVTAHVVEALGYQGRDLSDPVVARAVDYIRSEQESDGSWFGRWGVNHIYGTAAVLPALEKVGENMQADYIIKACDWLVARQNADGGWGETCASYMDDALRGRGDSTASQTAWALLALVAQGGAQYRQAIERGSRYLLETQTEDGTWQEAAFTGTGFPGYGGGARTDLARDSTLPQGRELSRGFMLRYHMYRHYFPLMALGRVRELLQTSA